MIVSASGEPGLEAVPLRLDVRHLIAADGALCALIMIGKGKRSPEVIAAMKEYGAVYFGATGGCGALLSKCIKKAEVVAYEDLGAEAIRRLEVEDFPVTVIIDSEGSNLYETGRAEYLRSLSE